MRVGYFWDWDGTMLMLPLVVSRAERSCRQSAGVRTLLLPCACPARSNPAIASSTAATRRLLSAARLPPQLKQAACILPLLPLPRFHPCMHVSPLHIATARNPVRTRAPSFHAPCMSLAAEASSASLQPRCTHDCQHRCRTRSCVPQQTLRTTPHADDVITRLHVVRRDTFRSNT